MKAMVWTQYGGPDVMLLKELDKPIPKDNEVLVKIHAASVNAGDCEIRANKGPIILRLPLRIYVGFKKPKRLTILGQEFSGVIEAVGKMVTQFKVGDNVFSQPGFKMGAWAEYTCLPENVCMAIKPANISYEQAAAVPVGGLNSLHFLQKAKISPGQEVLINGAGGSIGTFAVQIAKHYGAEVTAVDSAEKLDMLLSIGADHVIDYTKKDFSRGSKKYDVIFDIPGKISFSRTKGCLNKKGILILANSGLIMPIFKGLWTKIISSKRVIYNLADDSKEHLDSLRELIESGKIKVVVDKVFPLEQMTDAHRYVESGKKAGNVVISIS